MASRHPTRAPNPADQFDHHPNAAGSTGVASAGIHAIAVAPDRDSISEPDHDRAIAPRPPDRESSLSGARENISMRHPEAAAARRRRNRNRSADRREKSVGRRCAASVMGQGDYIGSEVGAARNEVGFGGRFEISR